MTALRSFTGFQLLHGFVAQLDRQFPSYLSAWNEAALGLPDGSTHYGYVHEGSAVLVRHDTQQVILLDAGQFFVMPGAFSISGGKGIVVTREDYVGAFLMGGPIEHEGRLKYIDGCTDSLLAAPLKWGDPCLNLLYFPPDIDQTAHTHPSDRIGMVLSGKGRCVHTDDEGNETVTDLVPGMLFCIHTDGSHKFQTPYGEHMRVLAYHPDSDFGPKDEEHPMINRTLVDGVSARFLDNIRTK